MDLRRHSLALCLVALVVAVAATPALGKSRTRSLTFTTGAFAVNCTSTGQLCSPPKTLSFKLAHAGTLTSVAYTTAATHCSSVALHVLRKGKQVAVTGTLPSGQRTERLTTHVALPKGSTTLGFQAQGFVGGCNAGRVLSWGGTVTVTVKVPGH